MRKRLFTAGLITAMLTMATLPESIAFAANGPKTPNVEQAGDKESKSKPSKEGKEKLEAICKKWDSLSQEKKDKVYRILDEEQKVNDKLLDQLASLGVIDSADAKLIKAERQQWYSGLKATGKLPFRGMKPRKE